MTKELFSQILSIGVLALGTVTAIAFILYLVSPKVREKMNNIDYFKYLAVMGLFSTIATISVLIYQYHFGTPVCELCWWQRIFMFPIEVIVLSSIWKKIKGNHTAIAALSVLGAGFAAYHYLDHLKRYVFYKNEFIAQMTCSVNGGESCSSTSGIMAFGFLSLPGMALIVFLVILALCFFASKTKNAK